MSCLTSSTLSRQASAVGVAESAVFKSFAVLFAAFFLTTPALAAKVSLPGQVNYRERIALPPDASLEIQLVDQTMPGAPPRIDVKAPIGQGQVPLSFTLAFEDALILPNHSYALIAAISDPTGLLFRNFAPYAVNPLSPAEPVLIVLNMVAPTAGAASSSASASATPPPPAILDANWLATTIGDKPVLAHTTPSMVISSDEMRAGGSTGCNSWFAQAELNGDAIRFGSATSTLKACTQAINLQEQAFKDAIAATASWRVEGDALTLYGSDGKALIEFHR